MCPRIGVLDVVTTIELTRCKNNGNTNSRTRSRSVWPGLYTFYAKKIPLLVVCRMNEEDALVAAVLANQTENGRMVRPVRNSSRESSTEPRRGGRGPGSGVKGLSRPPGFGRYCRPQRPRLFTQKTGGQSLKTA